MKTFLTATAISALMATSALADCPGGQHYPGAGTANTNGSSGFGPNFSINSGVPAAAFDTGSKTDSDCYTAGAISVGTGVAVTGEIVPDTSTAPTDDGVYIPSITAVYGERSTAIGHGASVGKVETYTEAGVDGILGDDPATVADESADDIVQTRLVPINDGTAVGAGATVTHNGSTALGAGSATTQENQIMIGKDDDRITAPGVKQAVPGAVHGIVVVDQDGNLGSDGGALQGQANANTQKNVDQDGRLDAHDSTLTNHDSRITANTQKNVDQDGRLDAHDVSIGNHNNQIVDLYNLNANQQSTLNAHSALLSEHTARLDEQAKGIAIAMAMPDAWLSDKKRFGIFGAVGGFEGETAVGFAAIGRIDETFSLNAKVGADTDFDHVGWQVGVGAQW